MVKGTSHLRWQERGFSLIELMIAMVLGLFIIGGVIVVFIGSSQSFSSNESLSRVQENGRFALELIARDLRNVGYKGACYEDVVSVLNTGDPDYQADAFDLNAPVIGWIDDGAEFFAATLDNYQNNTDIILIKHAAESADVLLTTDVAKTDINMTANGNIAGGQILILSNGLGCNMFQNTASGAGGALARQTVGENINNLPVASDPFTQIFDKDDTDVNLLSSHLYYIGDGTAASTALRRIRYNQGRPIAGALHEELIENVTNMTIRYGIASGAGNALDYSSTAADITTANDWDDVLAVRVTLTITGEQNIQHQFSTTVALRNRLLGQ